MRSFILLLALVSYNLSLYAGNKPCPGDTVYYEGFNDSIPQNWTIWNLDTLTPNSSEWFGKWQEKTIDGNLAVGNTSYFSPAGQADDWLITAAIALPVEPACLSFRAFSANPDYLEDYEIRIQVKSDSIVIDSFLSNPVLSNVIREEAEWTYHAVDLASYAGDTVYIAFRHTSNDQWALYLDDILITKPYSLDLAMSFVTLEDYLTIGQYSIMGEVDNYGFSAINSFDLNWKMDNGITMTQSLSSLNILPYTSYSFEHQDSFKLASSGSYGLNVWVSNLNGANDQNTENDTTTRYIAVTNGTTAMKRVLLEQFTGAWSGADPDGHYGMDTILNNAPWNVIGLRVHKQDAMEVEEAKPFISLFVNAIPSIIIDRTPMKIDGNFTLLITKRTKWADAVTDRLNSISPVKVEITKNYNSSTRTINGRVHAEFVDYAVGDLRPIVFIKESKVSGETDRYWQVNNYDFFPQNPNHPFVGKGSIIYDYEHDHVLRDYPLGIWGSENTFKAKISPADTFSTPFSYVIPDSLDETMMNIIGCVYRHHDDYNEREILNCHETSIWTTGLEEETRKKQIKNTISIYPNPAKDIAAVTFFLETPSFVSANIYNSLGQKQINLKEANIAEGSYDLFFDVSNVDAGVYFITVETNQVLYTKKFIVAK